MSELSDREREELQHLVKIELAIHALRRARDEATHGLTANGKFIDQEVKVALGLLEEVLAPPAPGQTFPFRENLLPEGSLEWTGPKSSEVMEKGPPSIGVPLDLACKELGPNGLTCRKHMRHQTPRHWARTWEGIDVYWEGP